MRLSMLRCVQRQTIRDWYGGFGRISLSIDNAAVCVDLHSPPAAKTCKACEALFYFGKALG